MENVKIVFVVKRVKSLG